MINRQTFNEIQLSRRAIFYLGLMAVIVLLAPLLLRNLPLELSGFPESWNIHLRTPLDNFEDWVVANRAVHPLFTLFFDPVSDTIDFGIRQLESFLLGLPWLVIIAATFLLGQWAGGLRVSLLALVGLLFMGMIGFWNESMQTLALMGVSVLIALAVGIPLGILSARYDRVETALRPVLDAMQTMPAFVYLIPVLLFFGIARVPSVVATIIYAIPPAIRLTNLGIRHVSPSAVEAARSFGSTNWQILTKVQLPLAMPAIMTGVNQTIMMALGIVVIAALIGAGGLGREVLVALQRLKVGRGLEAGLAIVFMAIILDRISHSLSEIDTTHTVKQAKGFDLLPNNFSRYTMARSFEWGLNAILTGCYRLANALARGLAAGVAGLLNGIGMANAAQSARLFLQNRPFLIGSVALLALLWGVNRYIYSFGPFPPTWTLPINKPVDAAVIWMRDNLYQIGDLPLGTGPLSDFLVIYGTNPLRAFFQSWLPWPMVILAVAVLAYAVAGRTMALWAGLGMFCMGLLGMWDHSMDTLSQVIVATLITVLIAIPTGILASRSDTFEALLRPVLDTLQTIPFFVYLVPVIMLFNVGRVPGIMASVLYALPPGIRLTNLGIRQIAPEITEAARSFGSTGLQTLLKVQLPLALPAIALGVNQVVMMVLAMVVVAGLVGGGGLGLEAVIGLAKNQTGRGVEAGLAIVIIAMIMDRITQAWAKKRDVKSQH
jgi:glycine betaine/proline transport system permease protein